MGPTVALTETTVAAACRDILGVVAERVELFAPKRLGPRESARVWFDGRSVIAVRRARPEVAVREADVLQFLAKRGCAVPARLAFAGGWLMQEDLGTTRLSALLAESGEAESVARLEAAMASLEPVHAPLDELPPELRLRSACRFRGARPEDASDLGSRPEIDRREYR